MQKFRGGLQLSNFFSDSNNVHMCMGGMDLRSDQKTLTLLPEQLNLLAFTLVSTKGKHNSHGQYHRVDSDTMST